MHRTRPTTLRKGLTPLWLTLVATVGALAALAPGSAGQGPAQNEESAAVLMPFHGSWANHLRTSPWEHSRTITEDWTMDVFAAGTDVHARIGNATGSVKLDVSPPEAYGCVNGGLMVWVTVTVDDEVVGRFGYHHLTDIEHPTGASLVGVRDVRIGRTTSSPLAWGGSCWNVSTAAGVHAHLVLDNTTGYSCYVRYTKGQALSNADPIAVLGGSGGVAWGAGPRAECSPAAVDAGSPTEPGLDEEMLRQDPPHLFRTLEAGAYVNDFQAATHPETGETLVVWHEYDGSSVGTSRLQRIAPDGRPIGDAIAIEASAGGHEVRRVDDVVPAPGGWVVLHDESSAADARARLVLRRFDHRGRALGPGVAVDRDPAFIGRLARDPVTGELVAAWTRPRPAGFEVVMTRFPQGSDRASGDPRVVQTGPVGEGLGVEQIVADAVTGSTYLLTQSGIVTGGGLLSFERHIVRISAGGDAAVRTTEQPADTSFTQSHGAVAVDGRFVVATHLSAVDGSMRTEYQKWGPGEAGPSTASGPQSTERPSLSAHPDGGVDIAHTRVIDGVERVAVTHRAADGDLEPELVVSAPLHPDSTLGDLRVARSPIDASLTLVTRERLVDLVRLAAAEHRDDPPAPPGVPRNVVVAADDVGDFIAATPGARLTVSWEPPSTYGGSALTGYVVRVEPGGHEVAVGPETTSTRVGGLAGGLDHQVRVLATNGVGLGDATEDVSVFVAVRPLEGYWMLERSGRVHPFGDAKNHGDAQVGQADAVALIPTAGGGGYWVLDTSGAVHAFGDAPALGDLITAVVTLEPGERAATMAGLPDDRGYWVFTDRGRAVAFGAAAHHGDLVGLTLNGPIIDSVATTTGLGYFQIGSDGGIFAHGDAAFEGSIQSVLDEIRPGTAAADWLQRPIVGLVPNPNGSGYWLVAADGGTFAFGDAPFRGSIPQVLGGAPLNAPVNGMVAYGDGYLMVASDGGVFTFSDLAFLGSLGGEPLGSPVAAIAPIRD